MKYMCPVCESRDKTSIMYEENDRLKCHECTYQIVIDNIRNTLLMGIRVPRVIIENVEADENTPRLYLPSYFFSKYNIPKATVRDGI